MSMRRAWAAVIVVGFLLTACSSGGGGDAAPASSAPSPPGYAVIDPRHLETMMGDEDVYLVNVHVPYEGEIPGTDAFIPYTEIAQRLDELPFGEQPVVIYCRSGNMSTEAAQAMVAAGAPQFYELGGGFYAWQDAGMPMKGA